MFPKMTDTDSGTYISHACDVTRRFGACPEVDWPFDPLQVYTPISWAAMRHAYLYRAAAFYKIESTGGERIRMVRDALAHMYPVVIGTDVGDNWQNYQSGETLGICPAPTDKHATVLVGDIAGKFIGENSWGQSWGNSGFYVLDPSVISSYQTYECWVITREVQP
jgi:hypothetical protein